MRAAAFREKESQWYRRYALSLIAEREAAFGNGVERLGRPVLGLDHLSERSLFDNVSRYHHFVQTEHTWERAPRERGAERSLIAGISAVDASRPRHRFPDREKGLGLQSLTARAYLQAMADVVVVDLSLNDCRSVAGYAALCAHSVLPIFEHSCPRDKRPRDAVEAAQLFAGGAERTRLVRDRAWSALRTAGEAVRDSEIGASEAARAAVAAAGAAYLHPLAAATQVKHILGSAAHAVRAIELTRPNDAGAHPTMLIGLATSQVSDVLKRYPAAPLKGGRVGELVREIDAALR